MVVTIFNGNQSLELNEKRNSSSNLTIIFDGNATLIVM